jgi:hypothetical protein
MLALKRSLLYRESIIINDLGFSHFCMQSPCYPLIGDYTEIFYMTDEVDIRSIQYKMSLKRPRSVRKVNGLNLLFIDLYVPVLIPRLNNTETSLQLSENTTLLVIFSSH